ncbi:MAG: hypothetical protein PHV18_10145 [Lachnospiraceae bacterium]|nr:hypothetical protein [Lachnospiraceae bacterium]
MKRKILSNNFIAGSCAVLFGGSMLVKEGTEKGIYAAFVFVVFVLLGLISLAKALSEREVSAINKITLYEICFIAILSTGPLLIAKIGFYAIGYAMICAVSLLLMEKRSIRNISKILIRNVLLAAGIYVVFTVFLKIRVPGFILFQ